MSNQNGQQPKQWMPIQRNQPQQNLPPQAQQKAPVGTSIMEGSRREVNKLTRAQCRLVENYLEAHWKEIEASRPRQADVANQATDALKFQVTKANLHGAAEAIDRRWPTPLRGPTGPRAPRSSPTPANRRRSREILLVLESVMSLNAQLGVENSPSLRELHLKLCNDIHGSESSVHSPTGL